MSCFSATDGRTIAAIILLAMFHCAVAGAADSASHPWTLQQPYRVQIDCPPALGDVAQVTVTLAGRTTDKGDELQLVDDQGNERPFEIAYHDPQLQTVLAFPVPDGKPATFWLYFGGAKAAAASTTQTDSSQRGWEPMAGILLRTYRKPEAYSPRYLPIFRAMLKEATLQGGGFVENISQGYNLFGPSQQYMSVYRGWLRIDAPGNYSFCTASADGSWITVNDQIVVLSPGPHGWGGMERGKVNGSIELPKGLARIDYFHEAGSNGHTAFMGWKPPGQQQFSVIPAQQWAPIRQATAGAYEARDKPIMAVPDVRCISTFWLPDSSNQQTALMALEDRSTSRGGTLVGATWDFGDGQTAVGQRQQHVYFRLGRPKVLLTVIDSAGHVDSVSCQPNIVLEDAQAPDLRIGNPDVYAKIAGGYDAERMPENDLSLYVQFWQRLEKWPQFVSAAAVYIRRFAGAADVADIAAAAADACAQAGADTQAYAPVLADQFYRKAIQTMTDPAARQAATFGLAKNLAWNLNRLDDAKVIYLQLIQAAPSDKTVVRNATIGLGDVELLAGNFPAAKDCYARAEQMADRKSQNQSIELAKIGSYPWTVEDYLDRGDYDQAIDTLNQWEQDYPLQKLEGISLLLRGKVLFVRQPSEPALRFLQLAQRVNPGGTQVPEAVWLSANCLMALGKDQQAIEQFARVQTEFTRSEFAAQAKEKIAVCEQRLESSAATAP